MGLQVISPLLNRSNALLQRLPTPLDRIILTLGVLALPFPLMASDPPKLLGATPEIAYQNCMTLTTKKAEEAWELASGWIQTGGGFPARHCAALALMTLKHYDEAGKRLQELGQEMAKESPELIAAVLGQAGRAWLLANEANLAYSVQSRALQLTPNDPELLVDRAESLAMAKRLPEAIDDLTKALALDPRKTDALVLRASAHRQLEQYDAAKQDVDRALAIDTNHVDGLLERGILRARAGDQDNARADWMRVLKLAPDGPTGDAARKNIENMDVKVEGKPAPAVTPAAQPPAPATRPK